MKVSIGKNTHYCNTVILATSTSQPWLYMHEETEVKGNKKLEGAYGNITGTEERTLRWHFHSSHGSSEGGGMEGTATVNSWLANGCNVNLTTALQILSRLIQAVSSWSSFVNMCSLILYNLYNAGVLCYFQLLVSIRCSLKAQCFIYLFLLLT